MHHTSPSLSAACSQAAVTLLLIQANANRPQKGAFIVAEQQGSPEFPHTLRQQAALASGA